MKKRKLMKLAVLSIGLVMVFGAMASGATSFNQKINLPVGSSEQDTASYYVGVFGSGDGRWSTFNMQTGKQIQVLNNNPEFVISVTDDQHVFEYRCKTPMISAGSNSEVSIASISPLMSAVKNQSQSFSFDIVDNPSSKVMCKIFSE